MTQLRVSALSDIGRVRPENEDRIIADDALHLYGVADGIGGLPHGGEAAQCSIDTLVALLKRPFQRHADLGKCLKKANRAVWKLGQSLSPETGIGSTFTAGQIRGDTLHLAHVGDSRCYARLSGAFSLLTLDHSVANELRAYQARGETAPYRGSNLDALTRCMGDPLHFHADLASHQLHNGDRVFFCTDGISRLLNDAEIEAFLQRPAPPSEILPEIIRLALKRGGHDNASGVLIEVDET